jgi:uncharacterized membrane protein
MNRLFFQSFVPQSLALLGMLLSPAAIPSGIAPLHAAPQVATFSGGGNEPFWSFEVSPKGITYSSPDAPKTVFPYVRPLKASGQVEDSLRLYKLRGGNTLIIQKKACSDGMSENTYDYSVIMILKNRVLAGCATKK